jgi:Na+-transporting NADH:ubiquinone oxidoreductase subunit B
MKALHNILESIRPQFEEGGKLSKFWVVFDSLETFAFTPGHTNKNAKKRVQRARRREC